MSCSGGEIRFFNRPESVVSSGQALAGASRGLHKFRHNADLRERLFATGETMIVEASPFDKIWGIGYSEADALSGGAKWGLNLLGKALVEARRVLRQEEGKKTVSGQTTL
ncbi:hypothetical protein B0H12DRAFT_1133942 [Mycena haematopus]|nr:hypothetical protein B0H12DRAFT_1133942 [Mycena haematopus]